MAKKLCIKDEHFVTIPGWVVTRLHLTSDDAIVYSIVNSFPNGFDQPLSFLSQWIGGSLCTARRIMQRLVEMGYIEQQEQQGKATTYKCRPLSNCDPYQNDTPIKMRGVPLSNCEGSHYNIYNNNNNNNNEPKKKMKPEKFVIPTIEEITEYCNSRKNSIDPEQFYCYYESKGWTIGKNQMKSWKAAVITWEKNQRKYNNENTNNNGNNTKQQSGNNPAAEQGKPYSRISELTKTGFDIQ